MPKLKLSAVAKAYGATVALRHGDFDLRAGEVHVLIGSNGSGKSTLCKIVAGSVRPDAGEVRIDDAPVTVAGPQAAKALGIGIFYQELSLSPRRSVAENICLPDMPVRMGLFVDRAVLARRAATYVALFDGVSGEGFTADATIDRLRPDQRQLVEIMKTLATEAPILIFDEPTSALDRAQVERFFAILRTLKAEGRAMVFISHRMDEIFEIGDRVTVIRDGTTIGTSELSQTDPAGVVRQMVGEREELAVAAAPERSAAVAGPARLEARALSGRGFSDVSFQLRGGEILGLGGLHGQGQSAVLRALFGAGRMAGGSAALAGAPYAPHSPRDAIRSGLAYVSGDRGREGVVQGRSILENLMPVHYLRRRLALASPSASQAKARPAVEALKTRFAGYSHPIGSLSGGNQQKIVIARWLIERPDVLLLDDPTKGIDLSAKSDLFALIRRLASEGMAILLYSSEDAELLAHSDRILVFNGGRVTRELTGAARTRHDLTQAAYEAA